ncbi:hypothetical protein [Sulfitobacter pontiacus]|jgi:hypothetical protein|uniref:hypothetical protein n=1 Tax=Sulfitobacter pontiacus TaxID=60137 RepID=UPI00241D5CBC|nr:hypothetical protein [Sulfitobacter pontiacus]
MTTETLTVLSIAGYVGAVVFAADLRTPAAIDPVQAKAFALICFCVGAILQITVVVQ